MTRIKQLLVAACAGLAVLSVAQAGILVSEKEVLRQSRVEWLSMKRHLPIDPDPRVQTYVQCIANRLLAVIDDEHKQLDWEVVVFDDDAVNAAALPTGKISVLNGLLRVADTPDSLAAVLGHEIAHATQNHVMERARKGARSDILVLLGAAALGGGQDMLSQGAAVMMTLPYAREQETEADLVGLQYMAKAGFDPRAAMYLWKNMSAANKGAPPEILSSHPSDDTRLDNIVKAITPALVTYNQARDAGKQPNCQLR
ncbi:MAG TPA: M48 family metallopeptidase [Vicinamibacterales bacterium]|jgi:predicted Zn-dependent protease|nr:M48 family metallopeptidase [Vicinamibacterales bacterium]